MNATTTTPALTKGLQGVREIAAKTPTVKKAKKIGVVGVSKAENVQLGLILKEIAYQFKEYNDGSDIYLPSSVLVDPEALIKLFGRYQNKAK